MKERLAYNLAIIARIPKYVKQTSKKLQEVIRKGVVTQDDKEAVNSKKQYFTGQITLQGTYAGLNYVKGKRNLMLLGNFTTRKSAKRAAKVKGFFNAVGMYGKENN